MKNELVSKSTISINAPASKVWKALMDPEMIKQYLFGTEATSDWKVGSPITYKGVWEGNSYEDKGVVVAIEPGTLLQTNYWSGFSGLPDSPENYQRVTYTLSDRNGTIELTVTQDNIPTEEGRAQSVQNWSMVLQKLKELLET